MKSPVRRSGRPLSFNREAALHQAMLVFWRRGYEGASIAELTAAMQVRPPSLYAAFGDKRALFLAAVDRYLGGPVTAERLRAGLPDAQAAVRALLTNSAALFTGEDTPAGCLLASAAITGSAASAQVQCALAGRRAEVAAALSELIAADIAGGMLPAETDGESLAAYVVAVVQGLSTLARDGAARDRLMRVVEVAMQAWPGVK